MEDSMLLSGAHITSSSGSLPGGRYPYQKTSSMLAGSSIGEATGPGEDAAHNVPMQLLAVGSDEVTDEETGPGA
jgi:hypothetical protein